LVELRHLVGNSLGFLKRTSPLGLLDNYR